MPKKLKVPMLTSDSVIDLALDTIEKEKQALVFVNTRNSAESQAERVAMKVKGVNLEELSEKILNVLDKPTKQCRRLAKCVSRGIAFHHSGLHAKQRSLLEDSFRCILLPTAVRVVCMNVIVLIHKRHNWAPSDIDFLHYPDL